jgi:surface protein
MPILHLTTSNPTTASKPTMPSQQFCFPADGALLRTTVSNYIYQNCATNPTCATRTTYGEIGTWCVKFVTDMNYMFYGKSTFNSDISSWDVSSVTTMQFMFYYASSFNSDISNWDVSSVINMQQMFVFASSFNSNISSWDIGSVTDMYGMFHSASSFNQNLCPWGLKLPQTFNYADNGHKMFLFSGCPNKNSPTGRAGPWCAASCPLL